MTTPEAPADLQEAGATFFRMVHAGYEVDARDGPVLLECCRCLDEIEELRAAVVRDGVLSYGSQGQLKEHPALGGLRAHRVVLDRMLVRLGLPDEETGRVPLTTAQLHSAAANAAQQRKAT